MDEYQRENMEVIKRDKKNPLLSNKDPSLSHLLDGAGPNTPNSVTTDGLNQSAMEVDGGFPEDSGDQDSYQLFEGHGDSYMPDLSPEASQMMLDPAKQNSYNNNNKADGSRSRPQNAATHHVKAEWVEGRLPGHGARNSPKPPSHLALLPRNKSTPDPNKSQAVSTNPVWNGGDSADRRATVIPKLEIEAARKIKPAPPQLTSPPADHYNMQLLAYSAQQQLEEQQRLQGESYRQGSSSDALQQLALKAKMRQEEEAQGARQQSKGDYFAKPETKAMIVPPALIAGPSGTLAQVQSRKLPMNVSVSAASGTWTVTDRAMPDLVHVQSSLGTKLPTNANSDIAYATQGSPIPPFPTTDSPRNTPKLSESTRKTSFSIPVTKGKAPPEPELKSPLDHPEHLDHQQRARFFSSEAVATNQGQEQADDEAPLNERDKEAALALRKLLEQSEKSSDNKIMENIAKVHRASPAVCSAIPRLIHEQYMLRNTPPPAYDQPYHSPQSIQHLLRPAVPVQQHFAQIGPDGRLSQDAVSADSVQNMGIKPEPQSPNTSVAAPVQNYMPAGVSLPGQSMVLPFAPGTVNSQGLLIYPLHGQHTAIGRQGSPVVSLAAGELQYAVVPNSASAVNNLYVPPGGALAPAETGRSKTVTPAKVPSSRDRKSSSGSSSSGRRNSDGSLTCGLCGHSFRSTPALNGHMRVHSSSDKKNKDDRHPKTASTDSSKAASLQPHQLPQGNPADFGDLGRTPPTLLPVGSSHSTLEGMAPLLPQQYAPPSLNQQLTGRAHNGLLTMASAASYLKTEPTHSEYLYQPPVQPPYMVAPSIIQPPPMVAANFVPAGGDAMLKGKADNQALNYPQLYAAQMQSSFPITMPNAVHPQMPQLLQQEMPYPGGQESANMPQDVPINPQPYTPEQAVVEKPVQYPMQEDSYPMNYEQHHHIENNSLSQLASIAVAAANRDQLPDLLMDSSFSQQPFHPPAEMQNQSGDSVVGADLDWSNSSVRSGDQGITQQNSMYTETKTSPIRTGHDPFILPVTTAHRRLQSRYGEYESNPINQSSSLSQEPSVTWHDNIMMSSYDDHDPIMREAVNVANPSKILPNSMMGGTPSCGSMFSSSSGRPFRQRHHSEGSHLIKSSGNSILKQMLHSSVPAVKLRQSNAPDGNQQPVGSVDEASGVKPLAPLDSTPPVEHTPEKKENTGPAAPAAPEVWAEPKPVQRRIRRRRHSADCRLLKAGTVPGYGHSKHDLLRHGSSAIMKKQNNAMLRTDVRVRRKPPPLVIPSSVNALAHGPTHIYHSHLHHRRRPSGDSNSSYNGVADKIPPYTPPPMISPLRAGSGLYCTTPNTPSAKLFRQISGDSQNIPTILEVDENQETDEDQELVRSSDPKINIGSRFQADIPDIRPQKYAIRDRHQADLVWHVPPATTSNDNAMNLMEKFMELSCSAAVPYGGSNKEYALDCLARSKGNILAAVKQLIFRKPVTPNRPDATRAYLGSGKSWTAQEVKLFDAGMLECRKDFFIISKKVKTRSAADCVERYYHVTKRHRRRVQRPRRFHVDNGEDVMSMLAGSPLDVRKAMKIESATSSSSDDEASGKQNDAYHPAIGANWSNQQQPVDSHPHHLASHQTLDHPSQQHANSQPPMSKPLKTHKARVQHMGIGTPSPAGSPASTTSADDQPSQVFTCPVCGKSFGKVKSRNAHMKTHGKQAQEKRRQREEEAARRREESSRQLQMSHVSIPRQNFIVPPVPGNQLLHTMIRSPHISM